MMIRKQVYIEEGQERRLKARARALGVTEAELIRQSLDRSLGPSPVAHPDPAAWERVLLYIRRYRSKAPGRPGQPWSRDELHDR
jgi:hypothetical protein